VWRAATEPLYGVVALGRRQVALATRRRTIELFPRAVAQPISYGVVRLVAPVALADAPQRWTCP
jgi:hypothetical protein